MGWTSRESKHAYDGINTWDTYSSDLSSFAGPTITAQTNSQDLLGMMLVLQGFAPAFIQSNSFCTVTGPGTYTATLSIALGKVSGVGNCLILLLGNLTSYGGGFKDYLATFTVTDTNGNTWAPLPPGLSFFATGSGVAAMGWYCTVKAGTDTASGSATTVTVSTSLTGVSRMQDYSVAIHEYSGIEKLSIPAARWAATTCYPNVNLPIYLPESGVVQNVSSTSDPSHLCQPGQGQSGSMETGPGGWSTAIGGTTVDTSTYVTWTCGGAPPGPLGGLLGGGVYTSGFDLHSAGDISLSFSGLSPHGPGMVLLFSWLHAYVALSGAPTGGGDGTVPSPGNVVGSPPPGGPWWASGDSIVGGRPGALQLRWSNDYGNTWGSEFDLPLGTVGQYSPRVHLHKLGYARDRVFWVRMTDPVFNSLINAELSFAELAS